MPPVCGVACGCPRPRGTVDLGGQGAEHLGDLAHHVGGRGVTAGRDDGADLVQFAGIDAHEDRDVHG
jgi:hypothetical protein